MQSQSTLPASLVTSSARWPIAKRRLAADAEDAVVVAHVCLVAVEELLPLDPHLAGVVRNVLARVLADRALGGRRRRRRVLRSARLAEVRRHGSDRSSSATHSTCGVCGNMSTGRARSMPVAVVVGEPLCVAGERRRVAADIDDARRGDLAEPLERLAGQAGTRRVDDDDVRVAGAVAQLAQHLADVAGEERGVADRVQLLVLDRAGDRLLVDLDPPHGQRLGSQRQADRADPAVQVVDGLAARQLRELARDRVQLLGHLACSSAGTRSAAPGSGARRSPPRSRPRPRAARSAGSSLLGDGFVDRPVHRLAPRGTRSAPRSGARDRSARRARSRAARAPGRCCALRGRPGAGGSPRASPGRTPRASPRAPTRACGCESRCRGRDVSQHFSISSTSSQRPALCRPSVGTPSASVNEYSILLR